MGIPATPEITNSQLKKLIELTPFIGHDGKPLNDVPVDVQTNFAMSLYNISWNILKTQHYLHKWSVKPSKEDRLKLKEAEKEAGIGSLMGICPNIKVEMLSMMNKPIPMVVLAVLYEEWSTMLLEAVENSENTLWKSKKLQEHLQHSFRIVNTAGESFTLSGYNWLAIFDTCVTDVMDTHKHLFD